MYASLDKPIKTSCIRQSHSMTPNQSSNPYAPNQRVYKVLSELAKPNLCNVPSSKKAIGAPINTHLFPTKVDRSSPAFMTQLGRRIQPINPERTCITVAPEDSEIMNSQPLYTP